MQRLDADGVEVRLRVGPVKTTTSGTIIAELEVTAPTPVRVGIRPPAPQPFGQLALVSETADGPVMVRLGAMEYRHRSVFTPFLAGTYVVPSFTVEYHGPAHEGRLVTAPVPIAVQSVVGGDPALAQPSAILPVAPPPRPREFPSRWLAAAGLLVVLAGGLAFRRRKRHPAGAGRETG